MEEVSPRSQEPLVTQARSTSTGGVRGGSWETDGKETDPPTPTVSRALERKHPNPPSRSHCPIGRQPPRRELNAPWGECVTPAGAEALGAQAEGLQSPRWRG